MVSLMVEEENSIGEKEETEKTEEELPEEQTGELEDEKEISSGITAVPIILCPEDYEPMEITGTEDREVEERDFLFRTNTETHMHIRYECPECGRYYLHDIKRKRQGCFIATAAFGTPLAKEIKVLRKFRDSYLVHKNWGRKLVSTYYILSPPIANIIQKSENLKKLVRTLLIPIIKIFRGEKGN